MSPGALLWTVHDTAELYEREGRRMEREDPTHFGVLTRAFWDEAFRTPGFQDVRDQDRGALEGPP